MHVALVAPAWPPESNSNGIVTYVKWMREGLIRNGCRVSILAFIVDDVCRDLDVYRIGPLPFGSSFVSRLRSRVVGHKPSAYDGGVQIAATLTQLGRKSRIDVVEMEESFGWAAAVREVTQLPVVVKLHGPAFLTLVEEELKTAFGAEKVRREGLALARLPFLLSPSRGHLENTVAHYRLQPTIAEHLVNPLGLTGGTRLWAANRCDSKSLLFVGRFDKIKGGDVVIRAFQLLLREWPTLRLDFVGPDTGLIQPNGGLLGIEAFVQSLDDPQLASAIVIRGRLHPGEIASLRAQAACVIVASRTESQGYTALEAMLQGCPVVCTDVAGLRESVQHGINGLKARSGDAEDLALQLSKIIGDPSFGARLGAEARNYVLAHHDPVSVAARTINVYQRAVAFASASKSTTNADLT